MTRVFDLYNIDPAFPTVMQFSLISLFAFNLVPVLYFRSGIVMLCFDADFLLMALYHVKNTRQTNVTRKANE